MKILEFLRKASVSCEKLDTATEVVNDSFGDDGDLSDEDEGSSSIDNSHDEATDEYYDTD